MMSTFTHRGISFFYTGAVRGVEDGPDGSAIIQVAQGQSVTIHESSPAPTLTRNGCVVDVPGSVFTQGFDSRSPNFVPAPLQFPLQLHAGQVLILSRSSPHREAEMHDRPTYWPEGPLGRSYVDEMLAVAVVEHLVTRTFTPMAVGRSPAVMQLRCSPIPRDQVDLSKLPSVVDLALFPNALPIEYLERLFAGFCGEAIDGWATDQITPDLQHPGYGRSLASVVSQAALWLCSNAPPLQKRRLAELMVQWGLHLAGAFVDGRRLYPLGGHCQGRKFLIVLAGHLLGLPPLADPDNYFPNRRGPFPETTGYFKASPAWWFGWDFGWRFAEGHGDYLRKPVKQWTTEADLAPVEHESEIWKTVGYMFHCCGAQVGSVLAARLMGLTRQFGRDIDGMVSQFMDGPPPPVRQEMIAAGLVGDWGDDYSTGPGHFFCRDAWRRYA